MAHLQLPYELYQPIFNEIKQEQSALQSSALACRAFASICQKHLFHRITLTYHVSSTDPRTRQLKRILQDSPHIATHVQVVTLKLAWLPLEVPRNTTINDDVVLEECLWMFENLSKFQVIPMESSTDRRWPIAISPLSKRLKYSIADILSTASISEMHLRNGFVLPLNVLQDLQHLKRLVLDDAALGDWNQVMGHLEDPSIGNRHIQLEKLWLEIGYQDYATPFFLHKQCYLHLNYLTSLSLTFPAKLDTYEHLNQIFQICGLSLEFLYLRPRYQFLTSSSVFSGHSLDITPLTNLHTLHLSIGWEISRLPFERRFSDQYATKSFAPRWAHTLLSTPLNATRPLPNLTKVVFRCFLMHEMQSWPFDMGEWLCLDDIMAQYPVLNDVKFYLHPKDCSGVVLEVFRKKFYESFRMLSSRNALNVAVDPYPGRSHVFNDMFPL
ncbi:hypothetical protein CVT24_007919 [Panaeolus cyanescens]|uniref:F-box domain-containing protein n=1 Tax=Panaeolus cyanescens TaxID=181874 RepID=A0A409W0B8_9AGAR|nr:hypothetical protein CVT24_007919 [Panaeolus cyanescens]